MDGGAWGGGTWTRSAWPSSAGPWAPMWAPGEARSFLSLLWANLRRLGGGGMSLLIMAAPRRLLWVAQVLLLREVWVSPFTHSGQPAGLRLPAATLLIDHC